MHTTGELALQRTQSIARGLLGTGFDQVGNRFGLCQIEFVIEKGTFAEFTGARQACAELYTAAQEQIKHHWPTMALQFQHVFAGKGMWAWEIQGQAFIQYLLYISEEWPVVGVTRF